MYSKMNTKFIAALAVFAMVFAGFGAAIAADDNDATRIGTSIVVDDSLEIGYANVDGDLYMVVTADLDLSGCGTPTGDNVDPKAFFTYHLGAFAKTVGAFFDEATMSFTIPYTIKDGDKTTTVADIVPASFLVYFTEDEFVISVEKESDFAVLKTIEDSYTTAAAEGQAKYPYIEFSKTDVELSATSIAAEDVAVYTPAEIAAIVAEAIAKFDGWMSPEQVEQAVNAAKQAVIDSYKDYKSPEEVQKAIDEAVAKVKGGDATIAWCVAAVGIIAALVLAGFVLVVFNKANKEGRRLL